MMTDLTRRRVLELAGCSGTTALVAGCNQLNDSSAGGVTDGQGPGTDTAADGESETTTDGLDLREANVVSVQFTGNGSSVSLDVTLHHDDEGEDGYADWWQVEQLDGTQIGRRELSHSHSEQPFTRSDEFEIPSGVSCLVVRGHDQTHGYGGQAILVDLNASRMRTVAQGSERQSFTENDCP